MQAERIIITYDYVKTTIGTRYAPLLMLIDTDWGNLSGPY